MKILIVDDEQDVRRSLSNFLKKLGHSITCCKDGHQGLQTFHTRPFDVVITDIRMPVMDGLELLRKIKAIARSTADVIVFTGHGDMDNAIKALKYGAFDYLQKPINIRELAIVLDRSEQYATLRKNYTGLKQTFDQQVSMKTQIFKEENNQLREAYLKKIGLGKICVFSDSMHRVIDLAEKYSSDRAIPVLLQGESGTGKELVARLIHYYGPSNTDSPFIAINCGAVTKDLFEGELFGHEPGAYTGATATGRIGKLEAANGGTLFLDEIGEMPLALQVKLLRVLEEKKFYRVGGVKEIPVDIRIVSATNKDLKDEVTKNRFRLDLFYRINTGTLHIPPLRDRKPDIIPLAHHFASQAANFKSRDFKGFSDSAKRFLTSHPWPGNVRQLKNAMERILLMGGWDKIKVADLAFLDSDHDPAEDLSPGKTRLDITEFELPPDRFDLKNFNRQIIARALEKNDHNQTRTARYLNISRRVLQGQLKKIQT